LARPGSTTHDLVVVMQENGEIHEDGAPKSTLGGGWLDAELRDTFPASDPLPHWAGPTRDLDEADRSRRGRRHGQPPPQFPSDRNPAVPR
jgi:hypothetical protein